MYQLFLIQSLGAPCNHHALFLELHPDDGTGHIFQVTGNIQTGMQYESKPSQRPENDVSFIERTYIGPVEGHDDRGVTCLQRIDQICRSNLAPEQQFIGPRRIDPQKPLRRCQEWTAETIQMLKTAGILKREH